MATRASNAAFARLRVRARGELEALNEQRRQLEGLLAFLDDYLGDKSGARLAADAPAVLELTEQAPGIRTSMLALRTGRSTMSVKEELTRLEAAGVVARVGRGWSSVSERATIGRHVPALLGSEGIELSNDSPDRT